MDLKVVGIVASPRKGMNTDTLVERVLEGSRLATVKLWCRDANIELGETLIVTDSERGESVRKREDLLHRAYQLGADLRRA